MRDAINEQAPPATCLRAFIHSPSHAEAHEHKKSENARVEIFTYFTLSISLDISAIHNQPSQSHNAAAPNEFPMRDFFVYFSSFFCSAAISMYAYLFNFEDSVGVLEKHSFEEKIIGNFFFELSG